MQILIVIDDYMPHSTKVGAKMVHELACEMVRNSHKVSVITPDATIKENLQISTLDGVDVYRFKSGKIKNVSKVKRAINETLLSFYAYRACKDFIKTSKHDYIIYYSPSIFFGLFVAKLKKLWGVKSYLILRDFFPQWTIDNALLSPHSPITYYFKFFEKINYDSADTIGVMSKKNLQWFKSYYKTDKKLEILYNWVDDKKVDAQNSIYKKKLGIEDKVVYFYGGNLGHAQDMLNIVRLAKNMQSFKEAFFVLVGSGDEEQLIKDEIKKLELKNIILLPSVNQEQYKQMLSEFEVGLFTLNKNHKTHNFPGKLLGYMVEELAIVGSINPDNDLKELFDEFEAGYISINPDDEQFFLDAKKLLDAEVRKNITKNAKILLKERFALSSALKQILKNG
jgi:glycosyltransferase involved in cell wall biosynthesis